jgi:predicted N-acetyltransferase YhbS
MSAQKPFSVRRARPEDATAVLDCLRAAFDPYRGLYTPAAFEDTVLTRGTVGQRFATMTVFVAATAAGEVVGTVACNLVCKGEGHLRGMAVRPSWQGRGVAEELLGAAEAELRRAGCGRVSLGTTGPLGRAVQFYEAHGFRASGTVSDFFGMELFEYVKTLESADMEPTRNDVGQPIGFSLPGWSPPPPPPREPMQGRYCRLEPLNLERHAEALFEADTADADGRSWTYLAYGPFRDAGGAAGRGRRLLRQPGAADRGRGRGRAPAGDRVAPRRLADPRHQPPSALRPARGGGGIAGPGERAWR